MARWLLPEGFSDVLPQEARRVEHMRGALLELFRCWGYELVMPPLVEYLDSLLTGAGADLDLRTFSLTDQVSGRMMGVRPDTTPQVARIDAHILNRAGVVRLCYATNVLHARPLHPLAPREQFQIGAELYGHAGPAADAETLRLAVVALETIGVSEARFDLGHTGVLRALLAHAGVSELADNIVAALSAKDTAELGRVLGGASDEARNSLGELTRLHGGVEVLERARKALPALPAVVAALDELAWLAQATGLKRVCIDLADLHGYRYHTGATFGAYVPGLTGAVLRGGRYDDIGRAFGRARPATGFSIDLRDLTRLAGNGNVPAILAPAGHDTSLLALIASLRGAGEVVVQRLDEGEVPAGHDFDREIRRADGAWKVAPVGSN